MTSKGFRVVLGGAATISAGWILVLILRDSPMGSQVDGATSAGPAPADTASGSVQVASPTRLDHEEHAPAAERTVLESAPSAQEPAKGSVLDDSRLDAVLDTYLTEQPEILGLHEVLQDLARRASVDPTGVVVDDTKGVAEGRMKILGFNGTATFRIDKGGYAITFSSPAVRGDLPWMKKEISARFSDTDGMLGHLSAGVQFHPDTTTPASDYLSPGQERIVGWVMDSIQDGSTAVPLIARSQAEGWLIGRLPDSPWKSTYINVVGGWHGGAFETWSQLLRPFAPRSSR